jgi:MFS family permease
MSLSSLLLAIGLNAPSQPLSIFSILTFVAAFSLGLGPVTWVVLPEVMPKRAVTAAGSVGLALNWSLNFGMGASFLPVQHWLAGLTHNGEGNIFYVFAVFCAVGAAGISVCYRLKDSV